MLFSLISLKEKSSYLFSNVAKISSPIPTIVHTKNWDNLKEGFKKSKDLLSGTCTDLKMEFQMWKCHWLNIGTEKLKIVISALNNCQEQIFHNIFALLTILSMLPVSTCKAEFSPR